MLIGLDFDNTIVDYDDLFFHVAKQEKLIPSTIKSTKLGVREFLRENNKEKAWTELQGLVYGKEMHKALVFSGVKRCLFALKSRGVELAIISHKTKYPYLGPRYDLHCAARRWIDANLVFKKASLIKPDLIFFKETMQEKISLIAELNCSVFIDDLPEILTHSDFPENVQRLLFDPKKSHVTPDKCITVSSWKQIPQLVISK